MSWTEALIRALWDLRRELAGLAALLVFVRCVEWYENKTRPPWWPRDLD